MSNYRWHTLTLSLDALLSVYNCTTGCTRRARRKEKSLPNFFIIEKRRIANSTIVDNYKSILCLLLDDHHNIHLFPSNGIIFMNPIILLAINFSAE